VAVIEVRPAHVNEFRSLLGDRLYEFRMAMPRGADRDPCVAVQEQISIDVLYPDAVAPFGDKFVIGTRITRCHPFGIGFDDLLGVRSRQFCSDRWSR